MGAKSYYLRVVQTNGIERRCKLVSNNVKRALMIQPLPKEYQEVEYLQASGTQYIDTGMKANQDTTVEAKFNCTSTYNGQFVFGARTNKTSNAFVVILWNSSTIYSAYKNSDNVTSNVQYSLNTDYNIILKKNKFFINSELKTTFNYSTFTTPKNIALFTTSGSSTYDTNQTLRGRIYYCKIWDNDTLARDFIPCYRKSDNKPGMFDMVNKVFYTNVGSGEFTTGNNVY